MKLKCDIQLPASKSESNRALMIAAYGGFAPDFQNLSESNDTHVLQEALNHCHLCHSEDFVSIDTLTPMSFGMTCLQNPKRICTRQINIADCGTAARFLTTYLACTEGDWLLTGSERMKQRPIQPLVDALVKLGADIQYIEKQGFLPLQIHGKPIRGGKVGIEMTQSSQFASSLLLSAPLFHESLELELIGEFSSMPYLDMTLAMMSHFGADVKRNGRVIKVNPKPYQSRSFSVSSDWSAASYWYEMAAFSEECEIKMSGLSLPSLQGDAIIVEWIQQLGVGTYIEDDAVVLRKIPYEKRSLSFDFTDCPDLYPTIAATCAGLQIEAQFTGIENLRLKESDRVEAMRTELAKLGCGPLRFCAHNDHRIVMALAPLSLLFGPASFDHPEAVEKSYPNFWKDADFLRF